MRGKVPGKVMSTTVSEASYLTSPRKSGARECTITGVKVQLNHSALTALGNDLRQRAARDDAEFTKRGMA